MLPHKKPGSEVFTELRTLDLQRNMIADPLPSTLGAMINLRQVASEVSHH